MVAAMVARNHLHPAPQLSENCKLKTGNIGGVSAEPLLTGANNEDQGI